MLAPCGYYKELVGINSLEWKDFMVECSSLQPHPGSESLSLTRLTLGQIAARSQSISHGASPAAAGMSPHDLFYLRAARFVLHFFDRRHLCYVLVFVKEEHTSESTKGKVVMLFCKWREKDNLKL